MVYSNTGYVLLALLIERVTNKSFSNYINEAIFKPLKMKHTTVTSTTFIEKYIHQIAQGYDVYSGKYVNPVEFEEIRVTVCLDYITGEGGIYSTVEDLWKLGRAVICAQLWNKELLEQTFTPSTLSAGQSFSYGMGCIIYEDENLGKRVSHTGGWPGYTTIFKNFFQSKTIFGVLRNKG